MRVSLFSPADIRKDGDMVSFNVSQKDKAIIHKIAKRASEKATKIGFSYPIMTVEMDITAVHANGNRLRLRDLRDADDFNFCHDVLGIRTHLNRDTGHLENFFVPRYSKPTRRDNKLIKLDAKIRAKLESEARHEQG